MAVADFSTYLTKVAAPWQRLRMNKGVATAMTVTSGSAHNGRLFNTWGIAPNAGVTPTTAIVPTNTTVGGALQQNSPGVQRLGRYVGLDITVPVQTQSEATAEFPVTLYLLDRLSTTGGLNGTLTTAQTTNLPTAALTRNTNGIGVMMGLQTYGALGTTTTTVTVSYTNQAGTAGRTSPGVAFGGSPNRSTHRIIQIPLQSGDYGVRSVESVTLAASTGSAGSWGVTLYRILDAITIYGALRGTSETIDPVLNRGGYMPEIPTDACLFMGYSTWPLTIQPYTCEIQLFEE